MLIFNNGEEFIAIYLEQVQCLGYAIQRGAAKKLLRKDKLPGHPLFAYNESKRTLAVSFERQVCRSGSIEMLNGSRNPTSLSCLCSMNDTPLYLSSVA
jgi:hypothetical protein